MTFFIMSLDDFYNIYIILQYLQFLHIAHATVADFNFITVENFVKVLGKCFVINWRNVFSLK